MVLLLVFLFGCGDVAPKHEHNVTADHGHEHGEHGEHTQAKSGHAHGDGEHAHGDGDHAAHKPHSEGKLELSLNGDAKWQMDDHTRKVMTETRASLAAAKIGSAEDGKALGDTLHEQLERLIKGCTMTGPDHDQLHVFLQVYIPSVAALRKAGDTEAAQAEVKKLQQYLADYDKHFE